MAAAAVPILIAATAASAGMSIYSGYQANNAAKRQAGQLEDQGRIAQDEANREAQLHADDVRRFRATQVVAFTKNGVSLGGSPLLVLADTASRGQEEVNAIVRSGAAERGLYNQKAQQTKNSGRAALIGGYSQAAGTVASAFGTGLFSNTNPGNTQINPISYGNY